MELSGKVAMISGGSKGLGAALARRFVAEGAAVSLCARNADELESVVREIEASGGRALGVVADVTSEQEMASWVAETRATLGPVNIMVNNASLLGQRSPIEEYSAEVWRQVVDVNLTGASFMVRDVAAKEPYPWADKRGLRVCEHALTEGVWLRPLGNVLVIMPPLAISLDQLDRIAGAIERVKNPGNARVEEAGPRHTGT